MENESPMPEATGARAAAADATQGARARLGELISQRRGVVFSGRSTTFSESTWGTFDVRHYESGESPGPDDQAAVLPLLTDARLSDAESAMRLFRFVATAVSNAVPIFAATPLSFAEFGGLASTDVDPWHLEVDRMLAREDLAALLSSVCEWRTPADIHRVGAAYLTPIEAKMADALAREGLSARAQVRIDDYVADFVCGSVIVECDGVRYHTDEEADQARDAYFVSRGYQVLRFSGSRIFHDVDSCADEVAGAGFSKAPSGVAVAGTGRLRPPQVRAINHGVGPGLVLAPAGAGKTLVVEERVKRLVRSGVGPSRVCALSFTNAAVREMANRIQGDAAGVRFSTIHSLASAICRETIGIRQLCQSAKPGGLTRAKIVRKLLSEDELRRRSALSLWVDALYEYRSSLRLPDIEATGLDGVGRDRFLEVHEGYEAQLRRLRVTDFEGLILDAIRILAKDPIKRLDWAGRFDYWIVDEFQDMPASKMSLLRLLVSPHRNVFLVGDDDQIIYGFAGASPSGFLDIESRFPDVREYVLDTNFRSPHELVTRTQWLIGRNEFRKDKGTRANKPLESRRCLMVECDPAYDRVALAWVQERLKGGTSPDDIALLFRIKDMAAPVEEALTRAGIAFVPCCRPVFYELPVVMYARAWLKVVASLATVDDYDRSLLWPNRYLTTEARTWLSQGQEQRIRGAVDGHTRVPMSDKQRPEEVGKGIAGYLRAVDSARRFTTPSSILESLTLEAATDSLPAPKNSSPASVSLAIFARVVSYFETVEWLERWIEHESRNPDFAPADDLVEEEPLAKTSGRVRLSSIHAVKGLEFRAVGVVGPLDGMPDKRAVAPEQLEEERRVAYVAATRAKEQLLFNASSRYAEELSVSPAGETWDDYVAVLIGESEDKTRRDTCGTCGARWTSTRRDGVCAAPGCSGKLVRFSESRSARSDG